MKVSEVFLKLMWPIRIFFLGFGLYSWLYETGQLIDGLIVLSGFAVILGLIFWFYCWADNYSQKNIQIYKDEQAKKRLNAQEVAKELTV